MFIIFMVWIRSYICYVRPVYSNMWLSRNVRKVSRGNINYSQEGENVLPMILLIHFLIYITHYKGIQCNNKYTVLQFWKWKYFCICFIILFVILIRYKNAKLVLWISHYVLFSILCYVVSWGMIKHSGWQFRTICLHVMN